MKARAFTLIELLIVIGIVAVLAAMSVSSLAALRTKARSTQCISNLNQWGMALQHYLRDNDGYLPRRGQGVQQVFQLTNRDDWFNVLPEYLDMPAYSNLWLAGKIPKPHDRSVFVCPAAEANTTGGSTNFITYGMNMYICRYDQTNRTKIIQLPNISTLAFLADSPGGYASTVPSAYGYSVIARHGGYANVAFFDGHVQSFASNYLGCGIGEKVQPDVHWKSGMDGDTTWTAP